MNIRDREVLRQQAQQRLSQATYDPRKLILLHTGVSLGVSFLVSLLSFLLSRQMDGAGGLDRMELRAALETAQTLLQLVSTVGLPFWQMGMVFAAIRLARSQAAEPAALLRGFYRFGPVLRLQILRLILISLLSVVCVYVCVNVYMMTPLAAPLVEAMTPLMEEVSVLDQQIVPDEAVMELMMTHIMPLTVVAILVALVVALLLFLRLRFADYLVMDGENRAMGALKRSWKMTKGNVLAMLKIDLSFWKFYLLLGLSIVISFGELLLPLAGVEIPLQPEAASFLCYFLYMLVQLALYGWMGAQVHTTYALAYDTLLQQPQPAAVPAAPANQPWDY